MTWFQMLIMITFVPSRCGWCQICPVIRLIECNTHSVTNLTSTPYMPVIGTLVLYLELCYFSLIAVWIHVLRIHKNTQIMRTVFIVGNPGVPIVNLGANFATCCWHLLYKLISRILRQSTNWATVHSLCHLLMVFGMCLTQNSTKTCANNMWALMELLIHIFFTGETRYCLISLYRWILAIW